MSKSQAEIIGRRVTLVAVVVNVTLIGLKFLAGVRGHSSALIADAVHSLSDLATDIVVLFGLASGRKPPDEKHPFGHGRIETMATALVGLALIGTALGIGIQSAMDIQHHSERHPTALALWGAGISIVAKEFLYHYTVIAGRRAKSPLIIANAWHHRSDAFSSVAVLIGVAVARIHPDWHVMDAYAALLVSFFILKVGIDILKDAVRELVDAAPAPEIVEAISRIALEIPGVLSIHDLRVRSSAGQYQTEIDIVINGEQTVLEGHRIAKAVTKGLHDGIPDMGRVLVHMDPHGNDVP